MKKLLLFVFALVAFAACEQAPIEEQSAIRQETPETITVGFEGDDTRIQLNEAQKTVWTKGDLVSVFYRSNANQLWKYDGETGARTANLKRVDAGTATRDMDRVVVVYPYNVDYYINPSTYNVQATLPATQHYLANSYGLDGNIMISSAEYNDVTLKNVCGWLKLQLTGDGEVVKSITFKGNSGEQVAGELYINSADATAIFASDMGNVAEDDGNNATGGAGANLSFDDVVLKEVTLDCGEGVTLSAEATAFYIALLPQTFDDGFTVEVACVDGSKMVKSSNKVLSIERNHIQPMAELSYTANISPSNQIWYTSSDGNVLEPNNTNVFGANIISNTYDNGKGVIIFDGDVTTIGYEAFRYCYSLRSVNIPDSVTTIGEGAFRNCIRLTSVNIPDSVTEIGQAAFDYCKSLTSVNIPDSVTTIGNSAFSYCDSLTSVTIGDSVTEIGQAAFNYCKSLTSVNIPNSITTIEPYTFCNCSSLTEFTGKFAEDNGRILVVDGVLTAFAPAGITEYNIPDSVTTIGEYAFMFCNSLTSVNIPDSVTTIGVHAFYYCESLTSVNIPDSVTTIGVGAFYGCSSLTSVNIPDSVTSIGNEAFRYCDSLTSVTIGDSVTWIGYDAFEFCNSLTSVYCKATTPPALGGTYVFDDNGSGLKIYVPAGSVEAYKSATYWNEYASAIVGYDFENGVVVEVQPNNEIWYTSSDGNIVEPDNTNAFSANIISNTYNDGKGVITFDGDVTTIGNYAFYWCASLTSVNIPDSVTAIGEGAFFNCFSLTSVNIPDSVTTIGSGVFSDCSSLTEFTGKFAEDNGRILVFDGVLTAFAPVGITEYNIPDSVTTIGNYAFDNCTNLTSVNIPDSITTIGNYAFRDCRSLTSVTIPDSVTAIGERAFQYCRSLTSVTIPDGVKEIGIRTFEHCTSLTNVNIGDSVTTIGEYAFCVCDSLTSVTIPDSVTSIGNYAFTYCTSLTSVYCKATTPPALGDIAFDSHPEERLIYVPVESLDAYLNADGWRDYADYIVGYDFETGEVTVPSVNLGICGTMTNCGQDGILDIKMEYLEDRNLYVAYGVELTTDDSFKLRSNNNWNSRYNIGARYYGCVAYPNFMEELYNGLNPQDIYVAENGTYDIYINLDSMVLYFMVEGADPDTASEPSVNLGICGTMTNWGQDGILDIEMEYLEDRNLYVAYGVELTTDDSFKLRSNNNWNSRYNIGARYYGCVAYPNFMEELYNGLNSQDIYVAENGTYDIYINLDSMVLYFVVEGADPDTASDMDDNLL